MEFTVELPDGLGERAMAESFKLSEMLRSSVERRLERLDAQQSLPSADQQINLLSIGSTSPWWWVRPLRVQMDRLDSAWTDWARQLAAAPPEDRFGLQLELDQGLLIEAFFCAVALRQVLRYADHYASLTKDPQAIEAVTLLTRAAGEPKLVRDVLEHLDDYRLGRGRERKKLPYDPNERGPYVDVETGGLGIGGVSIRLRAATEEAERLVPVWQALWEKHGAKVGFDSA